MLVLVPDHVNPPRSRGLRLAGGSQAKLVDGRFPHLELLPLTCDGHREVATEPDIARDLEVRDLALAVRPDRVLGELLTWPQLDPGTQLLAVLLIRHADDLNILDRRMAVEELLDLARVDVLAAPDHHVLDPADDVQVPGLVHDRQVAGVHPPGRVDRVRGLL